jgi:hypothetical protein
MPAKKSKHYRMSYFAADDIKCWLYPNYDTFQAAPGLLDALQVHQMSVYAIV